MKKLIKNPDDTYISINSLSLTLSPGEVYDIPSEYQDQFRVNEELINYVKDGTLQIGPNSSTFYTDPLDGEVWLRTEFDGDSYLIDGSSIVDYTPAIVTDGYTGKKGTNLFMDILSLMKELYNDPSNPLYEADFQKFIGADGRELEHLGRTSTLESIHNKSGWHEKEIKQYGFKAPSNLLIYYGYPNSFNSGSNAWYNEKVAQDMAKYDLIVLGTGVEAPTHPDYANTQIIIPRIKALNPSALIFGYVNGADILATVQTNVNNWNTLGVHGIFFDQAGYDYGTTATNSRTAMNTKIDYVHGMTYAKLCFMNCWNMDHIIGTTNDASYPNSTWNSGAVASKLTYNDWYLLESFIVNTGAYSGDHMESASDWKYRGDKAIAHRYTYGINLAAVGIIANGTSNAQALFDFHYISSLMYSLEAIGSSDLYYAANSVTVPFYNRPNLTGLGRIWVEYPSVTQDTTDADVYWRYAQFGRFKLDFSSGALVSTITKDFS